MSKKIITISWLVCQAFTMIFFLGNFNYVHAHYLETYLIDFDISMSSKGPRCYKKYYQGYNKEAYQKLKKLYEQNHFSKLHRSHDVKIPKIIHQIWFGSKPFPDNLKQLAETWKKFHPDWTYNLWTNDAVEKLLPQFLPEHQELYCKLVDPRSKADLLRYYLLYWYGGLYVDTDFECLTSFEELHCYYDFYTGISSHTTKEVINNALIGSKAGHQILKYIIENIQNLSLDNWMSALGVFYFSKKVIEVIDIVDGVNIVLPTNVLYCLPYKHDRSRLVSLYVTQESMAMHYWAEGGCSFC